MKSSLDRCFETRQKKVFETLEHLRFSNVFNFEDRPLVKIAYQTINFPISQPKHMLWVLKRNVSMSTQNIC